MKHTALRNELPAYALGSLSREEAGAIETHVLACAECREALHEYEEVMRLLPHALPVVEPPPSARSELLARLQHGAQPPRRPARPRPLVTRWSAIAAVLSVLLLMTLAIAIWGRPAELPPESPAERLANLRNQPTVEMLSMSGSPDAPSAAGQLIVNPGDTRAALLVSGLPPLPREHQYQFWFVQPDDTRVSGGVFSVDANGWAIVAVDAPRAFSRAWRCGVTEEPAGGSPEPTGRNVLTASYDLPLDPEYSEPG
ncbi:MAG TPA: anti-sigma factor [Thermomicrobiales bacterium]|nr:anti-sigma factor [Thermomicrobiales bacterium]